MHKRNRRYVAIGLIYGLLGGLLALLRLVASALMPGSAPGNPIATAASDRGRCRP